MSRHRMHPADVAWLHMDRPTNRVIVHSVLWTDEPLDWAAVRESVRDRIVAVYPRFSQRVVEFTSVAWWEDLQEFDPENCIVRHRLDDPGDRDALAAYVSSLLHHPLPAHLPLWQLHFVENFRGGNAIVSRVHHCVADSIALSRVVLSLCDGAITTPDDVPQPDQHGRTAQSVGAALDDLAHPNHVARVLTHAVTGTRALGRVVSLSPDVQTCLRGKVSEEKRALWSDPFPLRIVHDRAVASGATVNEFVLAAITGALRTYLAREDGNSPDIRAIVPVNLRPLDKPLPRSLGNRFGLIYLPLPVSENDPLTRLDRVRQDCHTILHSADSVLTFDLLDLIGHTPYGVEQVVVDLFASKGSAVVTNFAGPSLPLFLAGRRLRGLVSWAPESGNVALGLSITSFNDELVVGVVADTVLVSEPEFLLDQIDRELHRALAPVSVGAETPCTR
jgi:diacylglycerol O-acyltransferase / wax synthase